MTVPLALAIGASLLALVLGMAVLFARADLEMVSEAKDALAERNRELQLQVARLEREQQAWREGDRIRRRGVAPRLRG